MKDIERGLDVFCTKFLNDSNFIRSNVAKKKKKYLTFRSYIAYNYNDLLIRKRHKKINLVYILDLCTLVYNQDTFPLRCHKNRPDSSEDTPENSSSSSSPVTDNLINNKNN